MRSFFIITLFLSLSFYAFSQLQFFHFTNKDGLVQDNVEHILQDSDGYYWFSTYGGISKFDGYTFQNYTIFDTICTLPTNTIFQVYEDSRKQIWVATNRKLLRFNKKTNCFETIPGLINACITEVKEDKNGNLWLASHNGLFGINLNTNEVIGHYELSAGIPEDILTDIDIDKYGRIWASTQNKGFFRFTPETQSIKVFNTFHEDETNSISGNQVNTLMFDKTGNLWIGTQSTGIDKLDTTNYQYTHYKNTNNEPVNLGLNYTKCVFVDDDNTIWACRNGYLVYLDTTLNDFVRYLPQQSTEAYLNNISIGEVTKDNYGNIWIGSYGDGVHCIKFNNNFTVYSEENILLQKQNISVENIRSIIPYNNKIILVSDGAGILYFDPQSKKITPFENNDKLTSKHLMQATLRDNFLWCATWGGGICKVNLITNKVEPLVFKDKNKIVDIKNISYIALIGQKAWIGTFGDGIFIYDLEKQSFTDRQYNDTLDLRNLRWVSGILHDKKDNIWITTYDGLYLFNGKKVRLFRHNSNDKNSLADDVLYSVHEFSNGDIWINNNKGIDQYNFKTNNFKHLNQHYDIPIGVRTYLEKGDTIWISHVSKIYVFNKKTHKTSYFTTDDGIMEGAFSVNGGYTAPDGTLYFGGNKGFMYFDPNKFSADTSTPKIVFRNLYVDYKLQRAGGAILNKTLSYYDTLTLNYSNSVYSIELINANNFQKSNAIFSYKIENFSNGWITIDDSRKLTFSNLNPNMYELKVRATYNNEVFSTKTLWVNVIPPWWKTKWFKVSAGLLLLLAIYGIYLFRIKYIKAQNILLKRRVEEKTQAIRLSNKQLQMQNTQLKEKELLYQIKNDELEKSNNTKDKLFSIIAHDLKNPFSVILGFADILHRSNELNDKQNQQVSSIYTAAKNIYNQLETLLHWSKSQTVSLQSKAENICLESFLKDNITLLDHKIKEKDLNIIYKLKHTFDAKADKEMLDIVFRNLLQNAIKFTKRNGSIILRTSNSAEFTIFEIQDTGIGMSKEKIDEIMNANSTQSTPGTENESGTGLGLVICKDLLKINNAKIEVNSEQGEGSTFKVFLPKGAEVTNRFIDESVTEYDLTLPETEEYEELEEKPLILIVDDNSEILNYIVDIFSPYYIVETAQDGEIGYTKAQELLPNIIITDLMMPNKNGIELCVEIKKNPITNHIPIVILTARNEFEIEMKSIEAGAFDFIPKPFNREILLLKVKSILQTREKYKNYLKEQFVGQYTEKQPEHKEDEFIVACKEVLFKNYSESSFGVEDFADAMKCSRSQLFRKLKALIDISPVEYIKLYRLTKAKELIDGGYKRVSELAYDVGFNDPMYFSNCFKAHFGKPPTHFIKEKYQ